MSLGRSLLLLIGLTACQTGAPTEPVSMPVVLQPLFEACEPNDGAMTLQVFKSGGILTSLELVWKATGKGDWELELANAVGITLAHLERRGSDLVIEGKAAAKVPRLTVLADGFLAVDGEPIGIKASEIPCILGYRLPRSWLALARRIETEGKITTVTMGDERREMALTVKNASEAANAICTTISWCKWLLFKTELVWCQNPNSQSGTSAMKRRASLSGVSDYQLKWVSIDE